MLKSELLIEIGLRIRYLRKNKEYTLQELADACNFEKSNMSRIETGKSNLTLGTLLKISNALETKIKDLVDVY